jgi:hypothetical protein
MISGYARNELQYIQSKDTSNEIRLHFYGNEMYICIQLIIIVCFSQFIHGYNGDSE